MYPYILCSCGRSLGDLYDCFKEARKLKYIETYGEKTIDPNTLSFTGTFEINMSEIFDELCINMMCCRAKMTSQVEFKSLY